MNTLLSLLIFVVIFGLIYWAITLIPLPPPFKTIALVVLVVIAVIYLVSMLMNAGGALPSISTGPGLPIASLIG